MSDYKKQQRANEAAFKNRGQVLWTSCVIIEEKVNGRTIPRKRMIQGTYHNPDTMAAKRKKWPKATKKAMRKMALENRLRSNGEWKEWPRL